MDGGDVEQRAELAGRIYALTTGAHDLYAVSDSAGAHNDVWRVPGRGRAGVEPEQVSFWPADEESPTTDAKGEWLVYSENSRGTTELVCQNIATGKAGSVSIERVEHGVPSGTLRRKLTGEGAEQAARLAKMPRVQPTARCSRRARRDLVPEPVTDFIP